MRNSVLDELRIRTFADIRLKVSTNLGLF